MPTEIPNHLLPKIQRIIKMYRDRWGFETTPAEFFKQLSDAASIEGFAAEIHRSTGIKGDTSIESLVDCMLFAEEDSRRHPG